MKWGNRSADLKTGDHFPKVKSSFKCLQSFSVACNTNTAQNKEELIISSVNVILYECSQKNATLSEKIHKTKRLARSQNQSAA